MKVMKNLLIIASSLWAIIGTKLKTFMCEGSHWHNLPYHKFSTTFLQTGL